MEKCKTCGEPLYVELDFGEGLKKWRINCKCEQEQYDLEQKRTSEARFKELQNASGIGKEYQNALFKTAKINKTNKEVYEKAEKYVEHRNEVYKENHGLYIYGDNSSGKTHLACCVANELLDKEYSVLVTSLSEIVNSTFIDKFFIERVGRVGFLILDDLGQEFGARLYEAGKNEYAENVLKEVLDRRLNNKKPIIITSNYKFEQLGTELKLNKKVMERLNVALTRFYELNGTNFREEILEKKLKAAEKLGF